MSQIVHRLLLLLLEVNLPLEASRDLEVNPDHPLEASHHQAANQALAPEVNQDRDLEVNLDHLPEANPLQVANLDRDLDLAVNQDPDRDLEVNHLLDLEANLALVR